jgi:hypothetical protein
VVARQKKAGKNRDSNKEDTQDKKNKEKEAKPTKKQQQKKKNKGKCAHKAQPKTHAQVVGSRREYI